LRSYINKATCWFMFWTSGSTATSQKSEQVAQKAGQNFIEL